MASEDVARLLVQVSATTELLRSNLAKAERAVADFERDTNRKLSKVDGNFSKLGGGLGKIKASLSGFTAGAFGGFLASLSVGAITDAISNSLELAGSLGEVAQQLGVSTKFLQEFRFAATQNGATLEQADQALGKFSITLGKAFNSGQSAAIEKLGLNLEQLKRSSDSERYAAVAGAIAKIPDSAQRAAAAVAIFGKGALAILPTLEAGAEGFRRQAREAREFGLVLSDKQIQDADKTADKIAKLKAAMAIRFAGVVADNATEIGKFAESLANLVDRMVGFERYYPRVAAAIQSLSPASGGLIGSKLRGDGLFAPDPARDLRGANKPSFSTSTDFRNVSTPSSLGNDAFFKKAAPGRLGAGGFLALSGINFGAVLDQLNAAAPIANNIADSFERSSKAEATLGRDAQTMVETLREANRIALLRAEGRTQEAEAAEALSRVTDDVNRLDGLTATQRTNLLAIMRQLTLEGLRQVDLAQKRLEIDQAFESELADRVNRQAESSIDAMVGAANDRLDEYRARGVETERYLADTFETLLTQGSGGVWRQFKYEGLRAVAEILARLVSGQSAFGGGGGGGGGLFGSLLNLGAQVFGAAGGGGGFKSTDNILGRASGGPVNAGQPYIVGERRPELFIPRVPGNIIPSLAGIGGGVQVTINAPGATAETVARIRAEIRASAPVIIAAARNQTVRDTSRARLR